MDRITFKINDVSHSVGCEVSSDVTLLDYIRNVAELRGTKYMCREGGCGACIVSAVKKTGASPTSVNSCLVSVTSCQGWEITTVEKVGNKLDGYSPLQTTLAEHHGTQCGYCTPGWIMAMYSLVKSKKALTPLEIEKSFGSNVCRCTGYRPILDAFKKFATNSKETDLLDIEDLTICKKTGSPCTKNNCDDDDWCLVSPEDLKQTVTQIDLKDGRKWFRAKFILDIFAVLYREGHDSYMLVAGNTAKGAYPIEYPRILIDISSVLELKGFFVDQNLVIGANVTLSELLEIFKLMSKETYFGYLQKFYDHLSLVAHIPVRNLGTIAGNLMIKHQHNEFPSDVFLLLETVGAQVTILNAFGIRRAVTMQQFLKTDMTLNVIVNILLPPLSSDYRLVTFKIMPRAQSAHAIVNAGFLYKFSRFNNLIAEGRIVYGGLSATFVRAVRTELLLVGKNLFTNNTIQDAIKSLKTELIVPENPPEPSAAYRKQLAINLFYKGVLTLCPPERISSRLRSGADRVRESRPSSDGRQIFDTNPTLWPVNQPVKKLEALIQCSGEAPYSEDLPALPNEVFATFVLSTVPTGTIVTMNPSKALSCPGVIAFYSAKDIPGVNSFTPSGTLFYPVYEEIIATGEIKYFNQPIGIIVAESRALADRAAKLVDVKYSGIKKPVIDIKEAKKDPARNIVVANTPAKEKGADVQKVIKGESTVYGQYHFSMETLVCVSKPIEEGLEVHAATQWMDGVQQMTAEALNMDVNRIDVHVRRLGGAYGIKISRASQAAVACSLVAKKLNRPCRFIQSLTTNMRAVGKRLPCSRDFEVGVSKTGEIQYVNYDLYEDNGFIVNEPLALFTLDIYNNCYNNARWNFRCFNTLTDTAKNTWCRSPGTLEAIAMAEILMEQISYEMSLDPIAVRLANLDETKYGEMRTMVDNVKATASYDERRAAVDKFNKENRWKKRGLRMSLSRWTPLGTQYFNITVSVYHADGSVAITHGGIEMGQGINTKAAQIAAYFLKVPLEKIQVKANNTVIAPNGFITGGSLTSQNVGVGVQQACEELLARLDPIRATMDNPTWEALVKKAFEMDVNLQGHGFVNNASMQTFDILGVVLAEVEIDVLTGECDIIRVDILQDVGRSVSPEIDIGQIEGAFVMGLGYWTSEHLYYDKNTGEVLTDRTWHYHVPQARDIPRDFRVYIKKNSYSNDTFLGAKGSGEPPICLSVVLSFAYREAISEARLDSGTPKTTWFNIDGPVTTEEICMLSLTDTKDFLISI
ncbi:uncharacterized protein LOC126373065 [Pectinophora gossypiella]|uniref:uncharacterized protein LOC126373065 n=1 Tax=Pectinophora gossypiella TaxID=13191 RepID=UPI00214E8DAA|nr:uncharacterized protein LOC126373065 [Pectinophora gossypiella]